MSVDCYIGLGSNLDAPETQIAWALEQLDRLPGSRLVARAPCYRSRAIGPQPQPDYLNTAAHLHTGLAPLELLRELQRLEGRRGRVRTIRWGPRPLDLDILLYGDLHFVEPELVIPHPRLDERNFVLAPLHDLAPDLALPNGTPIRELLAGIGLAGIVRI